MEILNQSCTGYTQGVGGLGHGDGFDQRLPKRIVELNAKVVAVGVSVVHSLALTASGAMWSCCAPPVNWLGRWGWASLPARLPAPTRH